MIQIHREKIEWDDATEVDEIYNPTNEETIHNSTNEESIYKPVNEESIYKPENIYECGSVYQKIKRIISSKIENIFYYVLASILLIFILLLLFFRFKYRLNIKNFQQ